MHTYIIVTKNTADVVNLLSGYQNANTIFSDAGRRVYIWTNSTIDDSDNLSNLQEQRAILGLLLLPEAV